MSYICKYCTKSFSKEKTLLTHVCEKKRRWAQENETGVRLGFKVYLKFYEKTQGSIKEKSYEDFVNSSFYNAFVRFGRYLVDVRCINTDSYSDWILKSNKKIDYWTKDSLYNQWLLNYLKKESVEDAIERSIRQITEYVENDRNLENNLGLYFSKGNSNRICQHIRDGRVSAWVLYNCDTGLEFMSRLNQDQLKLILEIIDPEFWSRQFKDLPNDLTWAKDILKTAGL